MLDPEGFFAAAHRHHKDIFTLKMLGERWVVLARPDHVAQLFAQGPGEMDSGQASQAFRPLIGMSNMLMLDGEDYLYRRRMVLPAFHGQRMRSYETTIRETARHEIATWPAGESFPMLPRMSKLVFRVILRCVFGVSEQIGAFAETLLEMLGWITDARRVLFFFLLGPERLMSLPGYSSTIAQIDQQVLAEIATRRAAPNLHQREDILSLLICAHDEHGRGLSDRDLRDELLTLLVAGHENTTALLTWAIHELARDPTSQQRLAAEGDAFAEAVITETLRLRPPVPLLARRLRKPLEIAGHQLPIGTNVCPSTLLVHRRSDIYPDPWAFKPERFLHHKPATNEWFPFGAGIRRCIGAAFAQFEARITLQEICQALRLSAPTRPERTRARAIVLVPAHGAHTTVTTR